MNLISVFASTESSGGLAEFGLDPLAIIAQLITFTVLFLIVKKFALEGIVKTLEKRRETIDDGVRLGRLMETEKANLDKKVDDALKRARVDADAIITEGHQQATAIIRASEVEANRKVDALIAEAHAKINEDIASAKAKLELEVREMIAGGVEMILEEKLDASSDQKLLDRALESVGR